MTPEATAFYSPFFCGGTGSIIGLIVRDCIHTNSWLPIIVGSSVGGGMGCLLCIGICMQNSDNLRTQNRPIEVPVARAVPGINNLYVIYESGAAKNNLQ